ncbi:hypothetical protein, partial [Vibrio parahaemolyticus]|uniref:hypothetical protein n=1 Tax=Vibrio parahaemolyticus TaxID=670 RepID=UPI001C60B1C0
AVTVFHLPKGVVMNNSNAYLLSLEPINKFIAFTLDQYAIPSNAKRLALTQCAPTNKNILSR